MRTPPQQHHLMRSQRTVNALLGVTIGLSLSLSGAHAQSTATSSADPLARTTHVSISGNYDAYQAQRDAMKALIDTGKHNAQGYDLSKAKCWLEVSFHEYTRNDRSRFANDAFTESQRITQYLAGTDILEAPRAINGNSNVAAPNASPAVQTLLLNNGQRLRSDLWDKAQTLKNTPNYGGAKSCGMRQVACAEVELAHAGNEINQQGWRHARPYIQLAEDNLAAAEKVIASCSPPPPPPASPPPPPPAPPVVVAPKPVVIAPAPVPVNLGTEVLFNFDKRDMGNVIESTKNKLDALIAQIKAGGFKVNSIVLVGHADGSNFTRKPDYNTVLSQDRAETVKAYMMSQGITAATFNTDAKADSMPVVPIQECRAKHKQQTAFENCLLPNRRVVVNVTGVK